MAKLIGNNLADQFNRNWISGVSKKITKPRN